MSCLKKAAIKLFLFVYCAQFVRSDVVSDEIIFPSGASESNDVDPEFGRYFYALKRGSVVKLPKYGQLQGSIGMTAWTNRTIFQFLNVPYAESPSGSRRFKAPVPIRPWNGIRNAENYGTKCPTLDDLNQMSQSERDSKDPEDCLNMAIFSSNLNASRPVMVFIHGGTFSNNNADQYPPDYLLERDIVLVVVQYRLDALGFMSTNSREIPGNAGLMDCVQALKFIKENIEYFGGDPNKVTVFGQSSGAAMVSALLISPNVPDDLFHKAIIQSGTVFGNWAYTSDQVMDARKIAVAAGINPVQSIPALSRAFMSMNVLDLLKAVDKYQLYTAAVSGEYPHGARSLTIGGPNNLLPDTPDNIVKSFNRSIPIMIGTNRDDGSYFTKLIYDLFAATNKLNDKQFMRNDLVNFVCKFSDINDGSGTLTGMASSIFWTADELLSGDFGKCAPGIIAMVGTAGFKAPTLKFAQMNAQKNPHGTFLYSFDYLGEHTRFGYGEDVSRYPFSGGVHHSDELIYLFPYPQSAANLNKDDTKIAQKMVDLWTSFAINGVPEMSGTQPGINPMSWQPFSGPIGSYLHINKDLKNSDDYRRDFTVQVRDQQCRNNKD